MIDRVNRYYHLPASNRLVSHMRNNTGLTAEYQQVFDELRGYLGDTQFHADKIGLPVKKFQYDSAVLGRSMVQELVRLAEIGLELESKLTP